MKRDDGTGVAQALEESKTKVFWDIYVAAGLLNRRRASSDHALGPRPLEQHDRKPGGQPAPIHHADAARRPCPHAQQADLILGRSSQRPSSTRLQPNGVAEVEWANADAPVDRADVSPALYSRLRTLLTVTEISDLAEEIRSFVDSDDVKPPVQVEVQLQPIDNDTAQTWMLDREWLQEIVGMLQAKRQVIFYGPPGNREDLPRTEAGGVSCGQRRSYKLVQFHPSYSYEDFVEGYRPR